VEWSGEKFDCILLCVDRPSNRVLARTPLKEGLTGAKAANLLLDGGWGEVAIPSHITSDQGPQFVSSFLRISFTSLGIRKASSQAYRPKLMVAQKLLVGP